MSPSLLEMLLFVPLSCGGSDDDDDEGREFALSVYRAGYVREHLWGHRCCVLCAAAVYTYIIQIVDDKRDLPVFDVCVYVRLRNLCPDYVWALSRCREFLLVIALVLFAVY